MYIYIRSMSEAQSKIYDKITAQSREIVKHIIKLILYPDCSYIDHWQHEIYSFLNYVPKLKSSNKLPKEKFISECLKVNNDCLDNCIWQVMDEEYELDAVSVDIQLIEEVVNNYQNWLAHELATKGAVAPRQVKAKLSELTRS